MKKRLSGMLALLMIIGLATIVTGCASSDYTETYTDSTITGIIVAIDGDEVTLNLGELSAQNTDSGSFGPQEFENQTPPDALTPPEQVAPAPTNSGDTTPQPPQISIDGEPDSSGVIGGGLMTGEPGGGSFGGGTPPDGVFGGGGFNRMGAYMRFKANGEIVIVKIPADVTITVDNSLNTEETTLNSLNVGDVLIITYEGGEILTVNQKPAVYLSDANLSGRAE